MSPWAVRGWAATGHGPGHDVLSVAAGSPSTWSAPCASWVTNGSPSAGLTGPAGVFAFHLYLLAQPSDLPERMIGADPDAFFGHFLDSWTAIHAICDDYRASAFIDGERDAEDQRAGRRLEMSVLARRASCRGG